MKILAMDSSGMTATVAVVEDDRVLAEYTIDYKKTHSQTLLPMLKEAGRYDRTGSGYSGCHCGGRRSRLFYGPADRFCHGKRPGAGAAKAPGARTDPGGNGVQSLGDGPGGLPHDGCPKKPGVIPASISSGRENWRCWRIRWPYRWQRLPGN